MSTAGSSHLGVGWSNDLENAFLNIDPMEVGDMVFSPVHIDGRPNSTSPPSNQSKTSTAKRRS
jgi:hypothetical protein